MSTRAINSTYRFYHSTNLEAHWSLTNYVASDRGTDSLVSLGSDIAHSQSIDHKHNKLHIPNLCQPTSIPVISSESFQSNKQL